MTRREFLAYGASAGLSLSVIGTRAFESLAGNLIADANDASALDSRAISSFKSAIQGGVIVPRDRSYEAARRVYSWNPTTNKFPAIIVRCAGTADVIQAINFARANSLEVAVRSGAHDIQGSSVCGGGMVIDLSPIKQIRIDRFRSAVHVGAGTTAGELNSALHLHNLAACLGCDAGPGIAGVTLGGGMGWLMSKYGAACDNVRSMRVVTADGQSLFVDSQHNDDLFWGLRGGGGNFGVVTEFEYVVHPVQKVLGGFLVYPVSHARQFYKAYRELMSDAPDELVVETISMGAFEGIPFRQPVVMAVVCYLGDPDNGNRVLEPIRSSMRPLADSIGIIPYLALQRHPPLEVARALLGNRGVGDAAIRPLDRRLQYNHWKAMSLDELSDAAIDTLVELIEDGPKGWNVGVGHHVHGAVARVAPTESAFIRRPGYNCFFEEDWFDPTEADVAMNWVDRSWEAMQPYSHQGTYVNYLSVPGEDAVKLTYGPNYSRLSALKLRYDPTNFFHLNRNIKPAAKPA